jgi:hypothetical protein
MKSAASTPNPETRESGKTSCTTSMAFNFTVGAVAIVVAVILGYAVYGYFVG